MKKDCCKTVAWLAAIGSIGIFVGWYWDCLLEALTRPIAEVHFGTVLVWILLTLIGARLLNKLIFKD